MVSLRSVTMCRYSVPHILALIRDPKFPKRQEQRINFLADSVGGRPDLALRTSRDICEKERARQRRKSPHKILRHEVSDRGMLVRL